MDLPFELHVALRYLLARRKQAFISVISAISTLGVIVGVMALVIALALMTGLQNELRDRILGATPHIFVFKRSGITDYKAEINQLKQMPHVTGAGPAGIGAAMGSGALSDLNNPEADPHDALLLGTDLAAQLGVSAGDSITILTARGTL